MAILKIVHYPALVLRKKTKPIERFNDPKLNTLISDMAETMYDAPGVGLAANQVGISLRLAVIDVVWKEEKEGDSSPLAQPLTQPLTQNDRKNLLVFLNPHILEKKELITFEEGCLSLPGLTETVKRYNRVTVQYQDTQGNEKILKAEGLLAVALQHETDHLDGKLYIDHLSALKKELLLKKFKKTIDERT